MTKTPWFPMSVKPVRVGVYEFCRDQQAAPVFSKWNGQWWLAYVPSVADACYFSRPMSEAAYNGFVTGWRGLAEPPK